MTRLPYVPGFAELGARGPSPKQVGKQLRERVPRAAQGQLTIGAGRPGAVEAVQESNAGRLSELTPIRVGRMSASPFAFFRGAAGLMAYDLMTTPLTGIGAQICGDAHAANFGLYGDARGGLVIDLNDFDETLHGPWEWDVKRLVASLVLAGREAGADEDTCREAARDAAGAYRRTMRLLSKVPAADAWNAIADEELVSHTDARDLLGTLIRVAAKARKNTSARFAAKSTEEIPATGAAGEAGEEGEEGEEGAGEAAGSGVVRRRFVDAPPVLRRIPDAEAAAVVASLAGYLETLPEDRLPLLARYAVHDVAFRVVGTGSVGLRSYVVLLLDHRGEPLVLQVKEARGSALTPYVEKAGFAVPLATHEGRRIVLGQRRIQVVSDNLLGWTTVYDGAGQRTGDGRGAGFEAGAGVGAGAGSGRGGGAGAGHGGGGVGRGEGEGRPFQVRQFRNRKGSVDPTALAADQLDDYARMTGALLARAHAHSADPRLLAGYCGKNEELDEALADFAVAYADRTEADHAELAAAVRGGRIAAEPGV